MRLAFLASHGGSAARHITQACQTQQLDAVPLALASNNSKSLALVWAQAAGLQTAHLSSAKYPNPAALDTAIRDFLVGSGADTLVLSGYMRELGPRTLEAFAGRLVNIHPSLLPRHGGRGMYGDHVHEAVLASGDTESGASVHLVTAGIDEGPVLAQARVPVLPGDDLASLKSRVQAVEGELMLTALQLLAHHQP
ncbi:phosphoribosylglycinamide formyltransferase [Deinococcus sp.]|uniref:phosphoribosylglycinamide formyltransferase n=1 Tax=Deinococcus sp. TaxID=47478 RepID=UPI0025C1DEA9|nr:phosphoribosylglycinamide formyltransferase [Deinococcus sp.]